MANETEYCANPVGGTWSDNADAWDGDDGDAASTSTGDAQTYGNITGNLFSDMGDSDTIQGIEVDIVAEGDGGDYVTVELYKPTDTGYIAQTYDATPDSKDTYTVGGSANTWGETWSAASDIKNANFGVRLTYHSASKANTLSVYSVAIRVTYASEPLACEVYAAEAILDYEVPPAEVYAAEAILDYTAPAEVYAAEAVLDYEVPPAEVYAAEAILDYTAPAEAYAAEAILDYNPATQPAEVYAAEAILDYEVPPAEVYTAEAILDYEVPPAEVYAAEVVLDYEVPPAEVYAAEAVLDYEVPPAEVYAAEAVLDYTAPAEVYAAEAILDYATPDTGGGTSGPGRFAWPYFPQGVREEPEPRYTAPAEVYAAGVGLDYDIATQPAEVYAALAELDYEPPPADVYAAEVVLDYEVPPAEIYAASVGLDYERPPAEVYAARVVLDYEAPSAEMYAAELVTLLIKELESLDRPPTVRGRKLEPMERVRAHAFKSSLGKRMGRMRDPSMAGKIRRGYAVSMDRLFLDFKRSLAKVMGVRRLEDEYAPDMPALLASIAETIEITILIPAKDETGKYTTQAYTAGGWRGTQFLNALNLKIDFVMVPADQYALDVLKARNLSALKGISDEMSKEIMRIITDGVSRGDGVHSIARDIDRSIDAIGRTRANVMARTETMKAFNVGAETQFKKHGITEVEWLTAYDERVCDQCGPLNGQRFPIDDKPDIPLHPNCRCVLLPVIPDIE